MKTVKALALAISMVVSFGANAATLTSVLAKMASTGVVAQGLNLKEGDTASYNISMSIAQGTMEMGVDKIGSDGVWLHQNISMMGQQQNAQILLDPNTGEIKKMIVNGQEQTPPKAGDIEVVDSKEETITVPAGTFDCVYIKAHDKTQNSDAEQWINMKQVAVLGLVKSVAQTQYGPVTLELTSFKKM